MQVVRADYLVYPDWLYWQSWAVGIVVSLLLFASVLAHELAHSLVGRANGIPVSSITLFIFGGVAQMAREARKASAEFKMAAAGPACSLAIAALCGLVWLLARNNIQPVAAIASSLELAVPDLDLGDGRRHADHGNSARPLRGVLCPLPPGTPLAPSWRSRHWLWNPDDAGDPERADGARLAVLACWPGHSGSVNSSSG